MSAADFMDLFDTVKNLTPQDQLQWRDECILAFPQTAEFVNELYRQAVDGKPC